MNKCISILCLGLLLTITEVVSATPIVVDFDISLKTADVNGTSQQLRIAETRINSFTVRPGNPVVGTSVDDSECYFQQMAGGGVSGARYVYAGVEINGQSVYGTNIECLGAGKPETAVKSNQTLANEAVSKLWGGVGVWKSVQDNPFFPAPVVNVGDPIAICFAIGADTLCSTGEGTTKPADPNNPLITCSLPSSVEFQHGTLNSKNVNGNALSKNLIITCTGKAAVNISVGASTNSNDGVISLGSGISSLIKVNNSAGHTNLNLNSGSNSVGLSSVLSSSGGAKSGTYKGTGVLTLGMD